MTQKSAGLETTIDIRFKDLDALGHVNNAVFFTYFEEGRKNFFLKYSSVLKPSEFGFILAHISCDYLKPVRLTDRLKLRLIVGAIKNKSFVFHYSLMDRKDDSVVFARGESIQVCYDYSRNKSVPIPPSLKERLLLFQEQT